MSRDCVISASEMGAQLNVRVGKNLWIGTKVIETRYDRLTSLETDLLSLAGFIYAADLAIKREPREENIRTIEIQIPIVNIHAFRRVLPVIEEALHVLSHDNWNLEFSAENGVPEGGCTWPSLEGTTLLFSGGLDSFAGACDLIKRNTPVTLVSHITHNRVVESAQAGLVKLIEQQFQRELDHLAVAVYGRNQSGYIFPKDAQREETQRTRSFLFVALAAVAAKKSGSRRLLVMAENGQFAIHLPLTSARIGPFSTHTAHPQFLRLMQVLLRELFLCPDLILENPFVNFTKAEVVGSVPQQLRVALDRSISCWRTSRLPTKTHCGECIPCLSRRIALESHEIHFDEYERDLLRENIGVLDADDNGKRNLMDLLEFAAKFHGPRALADEHQICLEFPELINPDINRENAINMYRKFGAEASRVLKMYPRVAELMP